MEIEYLCFL